MRTEPQRLREPRTWVLLAGLLIGLGLAPIVSAPGVPATCSRVLELAARAGEPSGAAEREACEAHYGRLRSSRGTLGWTYSSWCTRLARTIPEAGAC